MTVSQTNRRSCSRVRETSDRQSRRSSVTLSDDYEDTRSEILSYSYMTFLVLVFGYSLYFSHFDGKFKFHMIPQRVEEVLISHLFNTESGAGFNEKLEKPLRRFGPIKFLTYNCLVIQFVSALLHLLSQKYPKFTLLRDITFTAFAFPLSCYVFCNFWGVYYTQGREVIYPVTLVPYYPNWLNHVSHTLIIPSNIGLAYLTFHRYINRGLLLCLSFLAIYFSFISYIKIKTGLFPYEFMNQMCAAALVVYLGSMFFCSIAFYQFGYFITSIFHPSKRHQLEQIQLI